MAGSKPGERRGGRSKGTPNKITKARAEQAQRALDRGQTPLEFMLEVMRDWEQPLPTRLDAAKAAAPYAHARLATIEQTGPNGGPVEHEFTVRYVAPHGRGAT